MEKSRSGKDNNCFLVNDDDEEVKKPKRNVLPPMEENVDTIASGIVFKIRKRLEEFTSVAATTHYPPRFTKSVDLDYSGNDVFRMPNLPFERAVELCQEKGTGAQISKTNLSALSNAFSVVRQILLNVSELLQQFSSRLNRAAIALANDQEWEPRYPSRIESELTESRGKSTETTDPQYNQYVYQIAFYLLEILGEQLNDFGDIMDFSSSKIPPGMKWRRSSLWKSCPEESLTADSMERIDAEESRESETLRPNTKTFDKMKQFCNKNLRKGRRMSDEIKQNIADALEIVCDVFSNVFDYLTESTSRSTSRCESRETAQNSGSDLETLQSSRKIPGPSKAFIRGSRGDVPSKVRDVLASSYEGLFGTPGDRFYPESASTASSSFFGKKSDDVMFPTANYLCDSCRTERGKAFHKKRAQSCPLWIDSTAKDFLRQRANTYDFSYKSPEIKTVCGRINEHLSGEENKEDNIPGSSPDISVKGTPVKSTQTSDEDQPKKLITTDKASLSDAACDCANRIIDDLIQMAKVVSLGDDDLASVQCAACDAIIHIDLSDNAVSDGGVKGIINLDDLIYNPGETDDPKCPCKGFYMLPSTRSQSGISRASSGIEKLCFESDATIIDILSLDLNEFTNSLRRKFREVLLSTQSGGESNLEEFLDSDFVNEKTILNILLECCRQASQMLKEQCSLLQEEYRYITKEGPSKAPQLDEASTEEPLGDQFADEASEDALESERKKGDSTEPGTQPLENEYYRGKESGEVSVRHVHTSMSSPGYPHHRVRFVSGAKESDGPSFSRSHGEHLEDVGFYFSEVDSDLSYLWDENDKYTSDLVEPNPHVVILQENEFPLNAIEVREVVNGSVYRRLEQCPQGADNASRDSFWRFQDGGNIKNSGVPLHHVPEQTNLSIYRSPDASSGPVRISKGDHALSQASILRNRGLAYVKPPNKSEPKGQVSFQPDSTSSWPGNYPCTAEDANRASRIRAPSEEWNLLCKIWEFLNQRKKDGFGRGPPLHLILHRRYAVEETLEALFCSSAFPLSYYKDLRVTFKDRQEREERRDGCQELFSLLTHQLFSKYHYGLFDHPSTNSLSLYVNPASEAEAHWFQFAGIILALALLHQKQMGVTLPIAFFKCILDRPFTLNDVQEVDPDLYETLNWLKQNKVSHVSPPMTFVIKDKYGDNNYEFELIPDGSTVYVTDANKFGYIEKAIKWKLAERCLCEMKEFRRGFLSILEPHMLLMFAADELQYLIARSPEAGTLEDSMTTTPVRRCTW